MRKTYTIPAVNTPATAAEGLKTDVVYVLYTQSVGLRIIKT